jgi:hypothetical protein
VVCCAVGARPFLAAVPFGFSGWCWLQPPACTAIVKGLNYASRSTCRGLSSTPDALAGSLRGQGRPLEQALYLLLVLAGTGW